MKRLTRKFYGFYGLAALVLLTSIAPQAFATTGGRRTMAGLPTHFDFVSFKNIRSHKTQLPWLPDGSFRGPVPLECRPESFGPKLMQTKNLQTQAAIITQFSNTCQKYLPSQKGPNSFVTLGRFSAIDFHINGHPLLHQVRLKLSDGRLLRGVLGLKRDGVKRPLIVTKCGVFCEAGDGNASSLIFMHLYEESPFNVLMLNSSTGRDFAIDNHIASLAGFDEGAQLFEAAHAASLDPQIAPYTTGIHFFGVSLGGLGALYASRFASNYQHHLNKPVFGTASVCSVVDLEKQMDMAFNQSMRGRYFEHLTTSLFRDVFGSVPILGQYLNADVQWSRPMLYHTVKEISVNYYKENYRLLSPAKFMPANEDLKSIEDFWSWNRFENQVSNTKIPTMVLFAADDYLVPPQANGLLLRKVGGKNRSVEPVQVFGGNHCAFSLALGWPAFSSILRSYISSRANLDTRLTTMRGVRIAGLARDLKRGESIANVRWNVKPGSASATITLQIYDPHRSYRSNKSNSALSCGTDGSPLAKPGPCYRSVASQIPLSGLAKLGVPASAGTKASANRIERWMNVRSQVLAADKGSVLGRAEDPAYVVANGYYEFR